MNDQNDARFAQLVVRLGEATSSRVAAALEEARRRREAGVEASVGEVLVESGSMRLPALRRIELIAVRGTLRCRACGASSPLSASVPGACPSCGGPVEVAEPPASDDGFRAVGAVGAGGPSGSIWGSAGAASGFAPVHDGRTQSDEAWQVASRTAPPVPGASSPSGSPDWVGRYRIVRKLGEGAMGAVFLAEQEGLDRPVALKVILAGAAADEEEIARFRNEARNASRLRHAGIVGVFDVGVADGRAYIAMEFVEGSPLSDVIRRDRPPLRESLEIIRQAALAVHYAHHRGIIHRDIKPANIMIRRDDDGRPEAVLTDFGLARNVEAANRITRTGMAIGTPAYMAPEQAFGEMDVGPKADIYALGATLYELVCGEPPFRGATPVVTLHKVINDEPIPPRIVNDRCPRDVETIILAALEKDPDRRFESAEAFADDLARFLDYESIKTKPPSVGRRLGRILRRALPAVVALVIVLAGALSFAVWSLTRPGRIVVRVEPPVEGTEVFVAGRAVAPDVPVDVSPGTWEVAARAPGFRLADGREVEVGRRELREIVVTLERETGVLEIEAEPVGATVWVDGRSHGTPLRDLALPTGPYRVVVGFSGHADRVVDVDIAAGETTRRRVSLQKVQAWATSIADWRGQSIVGDVDGDGVPDVGNLVLGSLKVFSGATGRKLVDGGLPVNPAGLVFADLDGDGAKELVGVGRGSEANKVLCVHLTADRKAWVRPLPEPMFATPRTGELSVSPGREVIVTGESSVVALSSEGVVLWRARAPAGLRAPSAALFEIVEDLDGDGRDDVLVSRPGETVVLSGASGSDVWRTPSPPGAALVLQGRRSIVFADPTGWRWLSLIDGTIEATRSPGDPVAGVTRVDLGGETLDWGLVVDGGRVTVHDLTEGGVRFEHAFDASIRDASLVAGAPGAPPVAVVELEVADDGGGRLAALGRGGLRWDRTIAHRVSGPPALLAGRVLVVGAGEEALGIDLLTGESRWRTPLPARAWNSPLVHDHDGDGRDEAFVTTRAGHIVALSAEGGVLFTVRLTVRPVSAIEFVDVDADGRADMLFESFGPGLAYAPSSRLRWSQTTDDPVRASPAIVDANGDGHLDVVLALRRPVASVVAYDGRDGSILWDRELAHDMIRRPAVGDVTGDGRPELILATQPGGVAVLDPRTGGKRILPTDLGQSWAPPGLGDVDGDGIDDVILAGWSRRVVAFSVAKGETLWSVEVGTGPFFARPVVVPPRGGGAASVIVAGRGAGEVISLSGEDGRVRWERRAGGTIARDGRLVDAGGSPLYVTRIESGPVVALDVDTGAVRHRIAELVGGVQAPVLLGAGLERVVADVPGALAFWDRSAPLSRIALHENPGPVARADGDGDGRDEVIVVTASGHVIAVDPDGHDVLWRCFVGGSVDNDFAVADLDGDGADEIVIATQTRSLVCLSGRLDRR